MSVGTSWNHGKNHYERGTAFPKPSCQNPSSPFTPFRLPPPPPPRPVRLRQFENGGFKNRTQTPTNRDQRVSREGYGRLEAFVDRHELREAHEAQKVAQEAYIKQNPSMYTFYTTVRSQLYAQMHGVFSLASGVVERNRNRKGDRIAGGIQAVGGVIPDPIPVAGPALNLLGKLLQYYQDKKQSNHMEQAAKHILDPDAANEAARRTAVSLCETYEFQLKTLTEKGADKFGRFICALFCNFIQDGLLEGDKPLHEQFIAALHGREKESGKWNWTLKFFKRFNIRTEVLETHCSTPEPVFASELLRMCGIRTKDGQYHANGENKHHLYGFRLGTNEEAQELGMQVVFYPPEDLRWTSEFPVSLLDVESQSLTGRATPISPRDIVASHQAMGQRYAKAEEGLQRAEVALQEARATNLHQSGAIVSLRSEINQLKRQQVQPIRRGNRSSPERVKEGLIKFYRGKSTIHSTFNDRDTDLREVRIPLALVKEKKKQGEGEEVHGANHSARVPVRLKRLAEIRRLNGNSNCQKILLNGSPGTGKSTFCQQAACLWANGEAWQDCTHLFVLPLRNLTEARYPSSECFLENILAKECFLPSSREEQIQLPADIEEVLKNNSDKVMIILDGYDEAAHMPEAIRAQLFDRDAVPYMIVTSQPHAAHNLRRKVDAVIEPHFNDDNMKEAIRRYYAAALGNPREVNEKATNLIAFLKEHPAWFDLARGPLLREALCMLWADPDQNFIFKGEVNEMELMERAAELMFSRHLSKQCDCPTDYESRKQAFSRALGKIALEMSKQGQYLVNEGIIEDCLNAFKIDIHELHKAGFLQITGVQGHNYRSVSFPHSLFQEYFAALYLATEGPRVYRGVMKTHKCPLNMQRIWTGCATLLGRKHPRESVKDYHRRALGFFTSLCKEGQEEFNPSYHNTLFILCLNGFENIGELYDKIDKKFGELAIFYEDRTENLKGTELEWQCTSVLRYLVDRGLLKDYWVKESEYYFTINPLMQALSSLMKKGHFRDTDITFLIERLKNRDVNREWNGEDIKSALESLREVGPLAKGAVPYFLEIFKEKGKNRSHHSIEIRLCAVKTWAKTSPNDTALIPCFIDLLLETCFEDFEEVTKELVKRGEAAVPYLISEFYMLDVPEVLGKIGGDKALSHIFNEISNEIDLLRRGGLKALVEALGEGAVPYLVKALDDEDEDVRMLAMDKLIELGAAARDAVLNLRRLVDLDTEEGKCAQFVLNEMEGVISSQDCMSVLCVNKDKIAERAMDRLERMGKIVARDLIELMKNSSNPLETKRAIKLLGKIGSDTIEAAPSLISSLKNENIRLGNEKHIRNALVGMGPAVDPYLIEALQDPKWEVRWEATQALGERGSTAKAAIDPLKHLAGVEKMELIKKEISLTLSMIMGADAIPFFVEMVLTGKDKFYALKLIEYPFLIKYAIQYQHQQEMFDVLIKAIIEKSIEENHPIYFQEDGYRHYLFCGKDKVELLLNAKERKHLRNQFKKSSKPHPSLFGKFLRKNK